MYYYICNGINLSCVFLYANLQYISLKIVSNKLICCSVEVPIPKLPHSMDGIKIALICDIHLGPTVGYSQLKRVVDVTNSLQPGAKTMLSISQNML